MLGGMDPRPDMAGDDAGPGTPSEPDTSGADGARGTLPAPDTSGPDATRPAPSEFDEPPADSVFDSLRPLGGWIRRALHTTSQER